MNRAGQGNAETITNFTKELGMCVCVCVCSQCFQFQLSLFIAEPSIFPKNITTSRISPTEMVVSWIPLTLSEARGFITNYTVFYSPQVNRRKRQEPNTMQKTVSGDVNQTTIDDLDPNTAYDVRMSASTEAGASAFSEVISAPVPSTGEVVTQLNDNVAMPSIIITLPIVYNQLFQAELTSSHWPDMYLRYINHS